MRDQRKAEEIAALRMQLLSPLLAEGLDAAQARQIKARICEQSGISERTLRRYLHQYRNDGFSGLKPKGKGRNQSGAISPEILEQAILLRREVPGRSVSQIIQILEWEGLALPGEIKRSTLLEEIRFLLNFKMDAQSPMTLILVGQSELWDRFKLQSYAAIRQRIDLQCKLPHLDRAQVGEYVKSHLIYAGADHDIFSDSAVDEIFKFSSGTARMVNKLCTHCLLYGAQNNRRIIDDSMVKFVIEGELN